MTLSAADNDPFSNQAPRWNYKGVLANQVRTTRQNVPGLHTSDQNLNGSISSAMLSLRDIAEQKTGRRKLSCDRSFLVAKLLFSIQVDATSTMFELGLPRPIIVGY